MEDEALHQLFAEVVDTSFAFTMAFNTHGADSEQAYAAHSAYEDAMRRYQESKALPLDSATHWDSFCARSPGAPECLMYDL
jgi:hypothetical protein